MASSCPQDRGTTTEKKNKKRKLENNETRFDNLPQAVFHEACKGLMQGVSVSWCKEKVECKDDGVPPQPDMDIYGDLNDPLGMCDDEIQSAADEISNHGNIDALAKVWKMAAAELYVLGKKLEDYIAAKHAHEEEEERAAPNATAAAVGAAAAAEPEADGVQPPPDQPRQEGSRRRYRRRFRHVLVYGTD